MNPSDGINQWRREQRAELLARRMAVPADSRRRWSDTITALLLEGFPMLPRSVVSFYWPFKGEFDPRFAIHRLRQAGVRAALPVVLKKDTALEFREWWPGVATRTGVFGLPIPDGTDLLRPDVLLIPPLGFDAQGYRLGYGGGYFDRTLAAMPHQPLKIALAFELSAITTIRPQPHDIAMDFIVTEAGIHRVSPNGLEAISPLSSVAELAGKLASRRTAA